MSTWYEKSLIKVCDINVNIKDIYSSIISIPGVKKIYAWGSYIENKNNPNATIKDFDLLVKTQFYSEDMLSIINDNNNIFKLSSSSLEEQGYNPACIEFTKRYIAINKCGIDHWAISSDKNILHWGSVISDEEERNEIIKESENLAYFETGLSKAKIKKASKEDINRWNMFREHYIKKYLKDIPKGWYNISCNINKIIKNIQEIKI